MEKFYSHQFRDFLGEFLVGQFVRDALELGLVDSDDGLGRGLRFLEVLSEGLSLLVGLEDAVGNGDLGFAGEDGAVLANVFDDLLDGVEGAAVVGLEEVRLVQSHGQVAQVGLVIAVLLRGADFGDLSPSETALQRQLLAGIVWENTTIF